MSYYRVGLRAHTEVLPEAIRLAVANLRDRRDSARDVVSGLGHFYRAGLDGARAYHDNPTARAIGFVTSAISLALIAGGIAGLAR